MWHPGTRVRLPEEPVRSVVPVAGFRRMALGATRRGELKEKTPEQFSREPFWISMVFLR